MTRTAPAPSAAPARVEAAHQPAPERELVAGPTIIVSALWMGSPEVDGIARRSAHDHPPACGLCHALRHANGAHMGRRREITS